MNTVTAIVPAHKAYESNVVMFLPGCEGEELDLRARLLLMRDRAMATKPIASEEGYALLDLIERTASRDAFRSMPIEELRTIRYILVKLVGAASDFDCLFAPQLEMGEANGRG